MNKQLTKRLRTILDAESICHYVAGTGDNLVIFYTLADDMTGQFERKRIGDDTLLMDLPFGNSE